jgi:hypothetical protein
MSTLNDSMVVGGSLVPNNNPLAEIDRCGNPDSAFNLKGGAFFQVPGM